MGIKILWIEDSARLELRTLTAPLYSSDDFDFDLAEDVTTAINFLRIRAYDVIIVDMRLPPGNDPFWVKVYQRSGHDRAQAHLGMKLLQWALGHENDTGYPPPPAGLSPKQFGVFTVEVYEDLKQELTELEVKVYKQKTASLPDEVIVQLAFEILAKKGQRA